MEWKTTFHKNINELWERAKDRNYKLTMAAYAQKLGTSRGSLRGWIEGKGQPDADGFVRIAAIEDVTLAWLLGDLREPVSSIRSQDERALITKYRGLSEEHKDDVFVLVDRFYERDNPSVNQQNTPQFEKRATS